MAVRPIDGDALRKELTCNFAGEPFHGNRKVTIGEVRRIIESMPTLTPQNEWISVEERLPKAEKEVRLFCITSNGYKYQCQGFYVPPGMHRDDSDYSWDWECCEQYDEDSGDYFVNPGWYESVHNWDEYSAFGIADKVTHWMPLPAPPKKEHDHE